MARPPKNPRDVKAVDLRIPVTAAQKQVVTDAMAIDGREFAGWARSLILSEAQKLLTEQNRIRKASGGK